MGTWFVRLYPVVKMDLAVRIGWEMMLRLFGRGRNCGFG